MNSRCGWVLLAFALVWFGCLDYRTLVKPDEGRYAEIAREMAASGDWTTPRLNGIKYFEKPPLQYWATAAAFNAFGTDEWTARLWPALTGFLGVALVWFAGHRVFGAQTGLLAAAVLASSLLYLASAQINTLDMGLCFFLESAVLGLILAQAEGAASRRWIFVAWAALALAVLSKGVVALVLTGGTLALYSLLSRDVSPWRRLEFVRGVPLFLAIAAPWFVAVSVANPEFPQFFFIHEHFERFLTTTHRRVGPAWYFVPILLVGALPWTGLALHSLATAWRHPDDGTFQPRRFLAIWCLVVFAFFSASGSKLPCYILPMFPALALLTADGMSRLGRRAWLAHVGAVAVVAAAALVLAPRVIERADAATSVEMMGAYAGWLTAAASVWLAGSVAALVLARRECRLAAAGCLATGGFVAVMAMVLGYENLSPSHSARGLAAQVTPLLPPAVPFYSVRTYEQTLPFYLKRTVTLVDYQDEMGFGLSQEPGKSLANLKDFHARWRADGDAFAIMVPEIYDLLSKEGLPMTIVARDPRNIVVRKPEPGS